MLRVDFAPPLPAEHSRTVAQDDWQMASLAQAEKIDFQLTAPIAVANLRRH
jgi:hypothetical protein